MQLRVIWNLVLQPDSEGPTLISHAAWRSRTTPEVVPSHLRGARRVARGSFTPRPSRNRTGASRLIRLLSPDQRSRFPVGFLPIAGLTLRRSWVIGPLRSMPITGTSTLLRAHPPLCPASVLWPSWDLHLGSSLRIGATGSQVPCSSQDRTRATFMPDAALAVSGSPQR